MTDPTIQIPEEFLCPLTLEIMKYPVMSRTGHSFEKQAIFEWLQAHAACPLTRQPMTLSKLVTNVALKQRIAHWCAAHAYDLHDGGQQVTRNDNLPIHFVVTETERQKMTTPVGMSDDQSPRFRVRLPFRRRHTRRLQ